VQKFVIEPRLQAQAGQNINSEQALVASGDTKKIADAISGLQNLPNQLDPLKRVLYELNADGVKVHTEGLIADLKNALQTEQAKINLLRTAPKVGGMLFTGIPNAAIDKLDPK